MPHISEGQLHAWIDGAIPEGSEEGRALRLHIESCGDCAARLDEARGLRDDASEILASVVPRGSAPSFEQIRQRAGAEADEPPSSGSGTRGGPVRMGWLSPQRLGWAATIALALGAGWIGRAVLEEKGWTDPFHEGQVPAATGPAVDSETAGPDPVERFADDALGELESKEVLRAQGGVARGEAPSDIADELEVDADSPRRAEAPAAAEALVPEDREEGDELMAPAAEGRARESRAKSVRPPVDPWHSIPAVRVTPASDFAGCYRLEYSWSPEVGYLPGTVELTFDEPSDRAGQSIFAVGVPGRSQSMLHEAIWSIPAPDSVWLRVVTGEDRAAFTVRAERSEVNWVGEGRVWTPGAPVSAGQVRGTVRLVRTECEPS